MGSYVPVKEMSVNDIVGYNCELWVHCDDHFFIFISFPQFIYDLFHISLDITGENQSQSSLVIYSAVSKGNSYNKMLLLFNSLWSVGALMSRVEL